MNFEDIFDGSHKRILSNEAVGKPFFEAFYERFLSDHEVAERFVDTDMNIQQSMLKRSFYNLFAFYASGHVDDYMYLIAKRHDRKHLNISPDFYDKWLECLIDTVHCYDEQFSDDVELAWRLVMTPGITYMKFKYDKTD